MCDKKNHDDDCRRHNIYIYRCIHDGYPPIRILYGRGVHNILL